jgi:hypothetical protein
MLTEKELNAVKGLLHYLNNNVTEDIRLDDAKLIDANGEDVAIVGWDAGVAEYVLKGIGK